MTRKLRGGSAVFAWGLASSSLMVAAAFGPWVRYAGVFGLSWSGLDGEPGWSHGREFATLALGGALAFVLARSTRAAGLVATAAGAAGATIAIHAWHAAGAARESARLPVGMVCLGCPNGPYVGWGVSLALVASVSLAAAGLRLIVLDRGGSVALRAGVSSTR